MCGGTTGPSQNLNTCEQFVASAGGSGDGRWSMAPALPYPVNDLKMAVAGGRIYAIGGINDTLQTDTLGTDISSKIDSRIRAR